MARVVLARGRETLAAWVRWRPPGAWWGWALALLAGALLAGGYLATQKVVTLDVDGQTTILYTHQNSVRDVLDEAQVVLAVDDQLTPALDAAIDTGTTITIQRPFTVTVSADGDTTVWRTHETTVGALLTQAHVSLGAHDVITVNGREADPQMVLGATTDRRTAMAGGSVPHIPWRPAQAVEIEVRRAVALTVSDEGVPLSIYTVQDTVGDALRAAGVLVYLADKVSPGLGTAIAPGLRVNIQRSTPYVITADGLTFASRTRKPTLGQAIEEEGLRLAGKDHMEPAGPDPVQAGSHVRVVRVREVYLTDDEPIAYKTVWWGDSDLELDNQRLDVTGIEGIFRRITQVVYEDGQEIKRDIWREWVAQEPITKVVAYGKKIVVREATMDDGTTIEYWRKFRVLATSYHEGECSKDSDHPEYGITYLGWRVGPGIVAVDPRVINLRGELYVPGYGRSVAGDIGSLIKGMRIDVYFPLAEYVSWNHWVTVYVLTPIPPRDQIRWMLPSYPVERQRWVR